ncbi:hypothetical protein QJS10_CPA09g00244 [Acorus calamus]|uniref:Cyclin-dependent kinase inhibitor n=1 Tax=Acorus calamus TaxID=4465 RepID=A0AAV9E4Z0_ACOCL|nr:hypothetical protein QJS10_CPA09g00244 [Acorus calamus]
MGKYLRKCKAVTETAATANGGGVRTRARTLALAAAAAGIGGGRRTRDAVAVAASEIQISSYLQLRSRRLVITTTRQANSRRERCRSPAAASRCSSNGSCELGRDRSLRSEGLEEEFETAVCSDCRNREATPSSDLREGTELDSMDSAAKPSSESIRRRRSSAVKMPSEAEIEEFFSDVEKAETKRFKEKYNYDIVRMFHWTDDTSGSC